MSTERVILSMFSTFLCLVSIIIGVGLFVLSKRGKLFGKGKPNTRKSIEASDQVYFCKACEASNPTENLFCDKCGAEFGD